MSISDEQKDELTNQWPIDSAGFPHRNASRIVIVDSLDRLFLILGHDFSDPQHRWWFTVGGGIDPGESPRQGALRELREETGLEVDPDRLIGPVLRRYATFYFAAETRKQDEEYFLLRISDAERNIINSRHNAELTALEQDLLDDFSWWHIHELPTLEMRGQKVYPLGLTNLAREWLAGWDGTVKEMTES